MGGGYLFGSSCSFSCASRCRMAWRPSAKALRTSPAFFPAISEDFLAARAATSGAVYVRAQDLTRRRPQSATPTPIAIHRTRFNTSVYAFPLPLVPSVPFAPLGWPRSRRPTRLTPCPTASTFTTGLAKVT